MAENSKIQWTTHTFNPWMGCTKVSAGCANCYAEELMDHRYGKTQWGPRGLRVIKADSGWREPLKWNRLAIDAGERHRVFCASLADVFEGPDTMPNAEWRKVTEARRRLFDLIAHTPHLDWMMLTKRPENALSIMVDAGAYPVASSAKTTPLANVWIGTSVEDQTAADTRVPHLLACPAAVRFLSCEPLLGAIDLRKFIPQGGPMGGWYLARCEHCRYTASSQFFIGDDESVVCPECLSECGPEVPDGIGLVIAGCESLNKRAGRFADGYADAARSLRNQCKAGSVAFFHKQMPIDGRVSGDMNEWPEDLRVREMPLPAAAR